jgi:glycosyltransferase involved in cell wall biosynthesis
MAPTCKVAETLARDHLPPKNPSIAHVVINSLVQKELRRRDDVSSSVIPNVFDFAAGSWAVDPYNSGFRRAIEVNESDVVVLQATRVVERKGIELAIEFVKELGEPSNRATLQEAGLYDGRRFDRDSRIVLVLAGYIEDGSEDYFQRLRQKIERQHVEARFIADRVRSRRAETDGLRVYSLWDCYTITDLVTYPSLFEGWGNQFLEAICGRLPIAIFEYPVYREDIKGQGFEVISLGREIDETDELGLVRVPEEAMRQAARKAVGVLTDSSLRQEMVDRNFRLGQDLYSLDSLERYLACVLEPVLGEPDSRR